MVYIDILVGLFSYILQILRIPNTVFAQLLILILERHRHHLLTYFPITISRELEDLAPALVHTFTRR